ncbi:hypothetical protein WJX77_011894 [Trebouxia sp. C0004]
MIPTQWQGSPHAGMAKIAGIAGTLPSSWGGQEALASLSTLQVAYTSLTGQLPEWGSSSSLQELSVLQIFNSSISGTLPPSWGSLLSSTAISISNTSCSGPLPAEWGTPTAWQKLTILDLTYNGCTGAIPQS